jgi:phosphodiesterase/alkaline phosphatase D-like protein
MYIDFLTTRPGKYKQYVYKFNITDTTPIIGHSRPAPYSARADVRKQNVRTNGAGWDIGVVCLIIHT